MKNQFTFCLILIIASIGHAQWIKTDIPVNAHTSCFTTNGSTIFAGTVDSGLYISNNDGANWTKNGLTEWNIYALASVGTTLFAGVGSGFGNGAVLVSTNNGMDWTTTSNASTVVFCFALQGLNLFAGTGTGSGVDITTDEGTTWKNVSNGLGGATIQCLSLTGSNLFAGTDQGVFLTTNNGGMWKAVNQGLTTPYIYSITASGSNIMVGTFPEGVVLTTDNGSNWKAVNNGLRGFEHMMISALTSINNNFFVGTDSGVFMSTNNGENWIEVNTGLGNDSINVLQVINGNLYAGTRQGTWKRPLSEMISTQAVNPDLKSTLFELQPNYPNPFSKQTKINYSMLTYQHVRITLSNILGDQQQTLLDEDVDAGIHELTIKGMDLSDGIYVVTMVVNGDCKTQNIWVVQ